MNHRIALLAASLLSAPFVAFAQPVTGPYVSLGAGVDYLQEQTLKSDSAALLGATKLSTNVGGIVAGAVGYGFGNGVRVELEGDWSSEKFYKGGSNYIQQYHGFVNGLYDFDGGMIGLPFLSPYIGGGVGYGQSHLTSFNASGVNAGGPYYLHSTGTDGNFAAQAILGLAFNIAAVPGLALTAEYRFITTPSDTNYKAEFLQNGTDTKFTVGADGEYNHVAMLGIRYQIFPPPAPIVAPPPPPPPPVTAAVTRTYLVFFDWDRADLTVRARQIVAEAASASTKVPTTVINVNGYTDLSGTAAYNQRLSVRRAQSVQSELIKDGVPAGEISIHGYGESNPLIPTAKGVREPQNRRVEIILH